jgi:ribosomal protein S19E (S16A)
MPNTPAAGSRHVIRTAIQQLEAAGLVELVDLKPIENVDGETQMLHRGRVVTAAGQRMLDAVAHDVRPTAEASYPGLDKY